MSHIHLMEDRESRGTTIETGGVVRDGGRQSKDSTSLWWPKLNWRALSLSRVPTPWLLHPSGWTPRPGWLLLRGLSSPECGRLGRGLHLCGLRVCSWVLLLADFLLPLTDRVRGLDWGIPPSSSA